MDFKLIPTKDNRYFEYWFCGGICLIDKNKNEPGSSRSYNDLYKFLKSRI